MGLRNTTRSDYPFFLTMTVVQWIDVFTRPVYKQIFVDSLNYCIQNKGLIVYAWVVMSNHVHLIAGTQDKVYLSDVLRDLKKFTSKAIIKEIKENAQESRKTWLLNHFAFAAKGSAPDHNYSVWQAGNEPKEIFTADFAMQKLNYIHENPVRAQIVTEADHYLYSSAMDYCGRKGLVKIEFLY